jgi:hypothetical protein
MRTLLILCTVLFLAGCGKREANTPVMLNANAEATQARTGPYADELFTLSVRPAVLQRDTRTKITLTVEKELTGRLLMINGDGDVLHRFREGSFEVKSYAYEYTPSKDVPPGTYAVILADDENNVVVSRRITLTDDVLRSMQ